MGTLSQQRKATLPLPKMRSFLNSSLPRQLAVLQIAVTSMILLLAILASWCVINQVNTGLSTAHAGLTALAISALAIAVFCRYVVKRITIGQDDVRQRIHQSLGSAEPTCSSHSDDLHFDYVDVLMQTCDKLRANRSAAEQRAQTSEARLRLIVDSIPALIAHVDSNCNVILANQGYENAYQITPHKLPGEHVSQLLGADVYAQSAVFMREALAGKTTTFERLVTHTGELRWERVSYVPEHDEAGEVAGFISLAEDITELKRAQHTFAKSEMRLRMITDNIPALIAYIDREEHYIFCNGGYETMLGLAPDKILGQTLKQVAGDVSYQATSHYVAQVLGGERVSFESATHTNGDRFFHTDFIPDRDANDQVIGFYSMVLDITARKLAELRQQTSEQLLRSVTDNLPALISHIDTDERFQFNNLPYEAWFGRRLSDITGQLVVDLMSPEDYARHQLPFAQALAGKKAEFEFTSVQDKQARVFQVTYLPQAGTDQELTGVCVMINDITALKQVENQLRILARFDTLTGLPNRNQFDEKLADAIARSRRNGQPVALMFLDIDHFKSINDTLGHHAGDDVLREFALRLTSSVRQTDTVARLAGDEFVIVLEGANLGQQSTTVAQKIIDAMQSGFDVLGTHRHVSTSIGIAIGQVDEADGGALLRRADSALYEAKAAGRNRFCMSA